MISYIDLIIELKRVPVATPFSLGIKDMGTSFIDIPLQYDLIKPSGLAKGPIASKLIDCSHFDE